MAETLISPGVLARENDQSQVTSQPVQAGAAIVGPTVLGRVNIPKVVTSYSEYLVNYGSTFASGSDEYTYFTSISAFNYFNNGGTSLIVNRVASGSWTSATTTTDPIRNNEESTKLTPAPFNFTASAGATAHGGTIIIDGDTSSRCGISMKGVNIIVKGSVGHMSAFMAQSGTLLICGNAGDALGDSIYETVIYLAGKPKSLGVDCVEKKMTKSDLIKVTNLLKEANVKKLKPKNFKKYGSSRKLYNFKIDNLSEY